MNEKIDKARELKKVSKEKRMLRYGGGMIEGKKPQYIAYDILLVVIMVLIMLICVVPMWHVLMSSFSDGDVLMQSTGIVWWPKTQEGGFNFGGYALLGNYDVVWQGYGNTLIYVFASGALGFVLTVLGGYALSRRIFLGKPLAFFIMFTMMFNGGLIPTYMVIKALGMTGTRWALIVPGCANGIFMLVMANAFRDVPASTVEAAHIDGAGHLTTLFKIMLPQAMSMATVVILNTLIMQWNSWYPASIYVSTKRDLWPLQLWIKEIIAQNANFTQIAGPVDYNRYLLQYVVIIIATVPLLAAFPFFLKYIEKGVIMGGVKE